MTELDKLQKSVEYLDLVKHKSDMQPVFQQILNHNYILEKVSEKNVSTSFNVIEKLNKMPERKRNLFESYNLLFHSPDNGNVLLYRKLETLSTTLSPEELRLAYKYQNLLQVSDAKFQAWATSAQSGEFVAFYQQTIQTSGEFIQNVLAVPCMKSVLDFFTPALDKTFQVDQLKELCWLVSQNEVVVRLIAQPFLLSATGVLLFLKVFYPLQEAGQFKIFLFEAMKPLWSVKQNLVQKLLNLNYNAYYARCNSLVSYIFINGKFLFVGAATAMLAFKLLAGDSPTSSSLQNAISAYFASDGGLNNPHLDHAKDLLSRISFEVGDSISKVLEGFFKGCMQNKKDIFIEIAKYYEKRPPNAK